MTITRVCSAQRARGNLNGGLTYITFGDGPPLVVFPGLFSSNANPTGFLLRFEMGWLSPLARAFTVYRINRKVGLAPDTTMADLASHYATAIEARFEGAIPILGFSTGGSIAQQFAADHPDLVRRLILAGTACRLGPETGRGAQAAYMVLRHRRPRGENLTTRTTQSRERAVRHIFRGYWFIGR